MKITRFITWEEVFLRAREVAAKYKDADIQAIFGVSNGGILPGYFVAGFLDAEHLYSNLRPDIKIPKAICDEGLNILVIDDILDSGKTKKKIMSQFKSLPYRKVFFETLFMATDSDWLIFPWENCQDKINTRQHKL